MTKPSSENRLNVLLGVTGGVAAYKSPELVRRLRDAGADVRVVMTESATRFVGPTTFQAVSGHRVRTALWDAEAEAAMGHIELARWADLVVVAPATAHFMATLAGGFAGDLLSAFIAGGSRARDERGDVGTSCRTGQLCDARAAWRQTARPRHR